MKQLHNFIATRHVLSEVPRRFVARAICGARWVALRLLSVPRRHVPAAAYDPNPTPRSGAARAAANESTINRIRQVALESGGPFVALLGLRKLSAFCRDFTAT